MYGSISDLQSLRKPAKAVVTPKSAATDTKAVAKSTPAQAPATEPKAEEKHGYEQDVEDEVKQFRLKERQQSLMSLKRLTSLSDKKPVLSERALQDSVPHDGT